MLGRMKAIPVQELLSRSRRFDIFAHSGSADPELLSRDLYRPPAVTPDAVVWGFPQLAEAARTGIGELFCTEVAGSEGELLELALRLENRTDAYSWEERAAVLEFMRTAGCLARTDRIAPLVSAKEYFLPRTEKFLSLPSVLRKLVSANLLDLSSAQGLTGLPEPVARLFLDAGARLSHSARRIVMRMLFEVFRRDRLSPEALEAVTRRVLESEDPQAEAARLRMPELSRMEASFRRIRSGALTGTGVSLEPPAYFEGGSYTVSFPFSSRSQLEARISALGGLLERSDELFDLLR